MIDYISIQGYGEAEMIHMSWKNKMDHIKRVAPEEKVMVKDDESAG